VLSVGVEYLVLDVSVGVDIGIGVELFEYLVL
jgi:hypothetical protein